jgi:hypothetical protein
VDKSLQRKMSRWRRFNSLRSPSPTLTDADACHDDPRSGLLRKTIAWRVQVSHHQQGNVQKSKKKLDRDHKHVLDYAPSGDCGDP